MDSEMSYRQKSDTAIRDLLHEFECQPILFVGSGLSKRFFGAPNWHELLRMVFAEIPNGADRYEYFRQKYENDPVSVGTELANEIFEWAWKDGKEKFPADIFTSKEGKEKFLKYLVAEVFKSATPKLADITNKEICLEIEGLREIKPHAIITTNYDLFLEQIFDGYATITGQTIIKYNTNSFGEIFHIHGDVTDMNSIIITKSDYEFWADRKKYVSAKLLTYFAEHPVFIFGYGMGDDNVKSILRDIGELVADENGLISNVYQIFWQADDVQNNPPDQAIFAVDSKEYRTRAIYTNDFKWILEALKGRSSLTSINPKLVRALAARTMKLIRHDIPAGIVKVNYDILERVATENDELPKLLGITTINNPNQSHPFTISQIAQRVGMKNWQEVNKVLKDVKERTGIDIRSTDNRYHCKIKTGTKLSSIARKWSHEFVSLLNGISSGQEVKIEL